MPKIIAKTTNWAYRITASPRFFVATILLLVIQSVWMAFTAVYPLPFDEYVHVGIIQIYARQWLPFIAEQPANASIYGDITRIPDYLYHYLMSFPYRFFDLFMDSEMALVIAMRLINVVFVVGGVVLFRKLLLKWGVSRRLVHVVLLAFVATPIIPFLAAHVNYDNLMFLLAPVFLLLATRLIKSNDGLIVNGLLFSLLWLVLLLTKQTFLPAALAAGGYVAYRVWSRNRGKLAKVFKKSWQKTAKGMPFVLVCAGLIIMSALFSERYIGNTLQYGTFRPECHEVQPRPVCEDYSPWYRNNVTNVVNRPDEPPYGNPVSYSQYWLTRMMRGFYALFAHTPTNATEQEPFGPIEVRPLLPLPVNVGYAVLVAGMGALILQRKQLWRQQYLRFGLVLSGVYVVAVWAFNYQSYLEFWKGEAIQARYTLPVFIVMLAIMAQSVSWSIASRKAKAGLFVVFLLLYVWGGGIAGWLIRAEDTWRWQHATVQSVNRTVQTGLRSFVIH